NVVVACGGPVAGNAALALNELVGAAAAQGLYLLRRTRIAEAPVLLPVLAIKSSACQGSSPELFSDGDGCRHFCQQVSSALVKGGRALVVAPPATGGCCSGTPFSS